MDQNVTGFALSKADLRLFRQLEPAFRNLLVLPELTPEEIVGIARAIRFIQRLPLSSAGINVSITQDYQSPNYVASSTITLSSDELIAEYGAASPIGGDYESSSPFEFRISLDGDYEVEGDKHDFFSNFIASTENIRASGYSVTITDSSTVVTLPALAVDFPADI
jgi:hypothetical protein